MLPGAGVGNDAPRRDGAVAQRPQEFLIPVRAQFRRSFDLGQRPRHPLAGAVNGLVNRPPVFSLQPVFLIPDIPGSRLHGNVGSSGRTVDGLQVRGFHDSVVSRGPVSVEGNHQILEDIESKIPDVDSI